MSAQLRLGFLLLVLGLGWPRLAGEGGKAPAASETRQALAALAGDDPVTAEKLLRPLAESGSADAQHVLGFLYDLGLGVPIDPKLGNAWQEKAAGQGHYWARLYLGWKLGLGLGVDKPDATRATALQAVLYEQRASARLVPEDWLKVSGLKFNPNYRRAARWLKSRAELKDAAAAFTLAEYYDMGLVDGRRNLTEHLRWVKTAATGGSAAALVRLRLYYGLGILVEKNPAQAKEYLVKAAAAGDADSQYDLAEAYADGDGVEKNPATARGWYERSARAGHVKAINALADLLRKGAAGVPVNPGEARRLSQQAADLGDAEAMTDLANMWRNGEGGPKDRGEAVRWFRAAAERKYPYGQFMVGWMLMYDAETPDYGEARRWYEIAAATGSEGAMREMGFLYENGRGVAKDLALAFTWTEKAARKGNAAAQSHLGWMLLYGEGVERDPEEAATWFRLAAKQGLAEAQSNLAHLLLNGADGVAKDLPEALRLSRLAAEAGDAASQNRLGWMLQHGLGAAVDPAAAVAWYRRAVAQKNPQAIYNLAVLLADGASGVPKDPSESLRLYRLAAEAGDAGAQNHLGWMLREGIGTSQDDAEALAWFRKAAGNGFALGEANLGFHYLYGRGVERNLVEAFNHLATALRTLDDDWASATFLQIFWLARPEEKPALEALLRACIADPALLDAKGSLPETCVRAPGLLHPKIGRDELAAGLITRLAAKNRPGSAGLLAWHAFIGQNLPYDLEKARSWAQAAAKTGSTRDRYVLAYIDSFCGPDQAARSAASAELHRLADAGHDQSAFVLSFRHALGFIEEQDPDKALRYYNLAVRPPESSFDGLLLAFRRTRAIKMLPQDPDGLAPATPDLDARTPMSRVVLFPPELMVDGLEGRATVEAVVAGGGRVETVEVIESSHPVLAAAAAASMRQWVFSPNIKNGSPVTTRITQTIEFHAP